MNNDYFSFMSAKGEPKHAKQRDRAAAPPRKFPARADTIDFVDETHIEVTESFVSDTTIQRIFKRFKAA